MDWPRLITSALTAGIVAGGNGVLAILAEGKEPSYTTWIFAGVTFLVGCALNVQSHLAPSPRHTHQ